MSSLSFAWHSSQLHSEDRWQLLNSEENTVDLLHLVSLDL